MKWEQIRALPRWTTKKVTQIFRDEAVVQGFEEGAMARGFEEWVVTQGFKEGGAALGFYNKKRIYTWERRVFLKSVK